MKQKSPYFSIIMPVYKVEKYLDEAANSVLNQSYDDFELILVDDCSPDNCPKMCEDFAIKDKRVKVLHNQKNSGLGITRNNGLKVAEGKFVLFMDSDDTITPDCLEILSSEVEGYDITVFGMTRFYEDKQGKVYKTDSQIPVPTTTEKLSQVGQLLIELNKARVFPFACNKAYNREFLISSGIEFEPTKLIEDFLFNIQLFEKTEKIKVIENCFYNYRKPATQTLVSAYSPEFFNLVKRKFGMEKTFLKHTKSDTQENLQYVYFIFIKHLVSVFIRNGSKSAKLSQKQQREKIKEVLSDSVTKNVLSKYKPQGLALKILTEVLKSGNTLLCYYMVTVVKILIK